MDLRKQINSWEDILLETHAEKAPNIINCVFNALLVINAFLGIIAYYIKDFIFFIIFLAFVFVYVVPLRNLG